MLANVFVSKAMQDGEPVAMLVLPYGPLAAIRRHLQPVDWRYLATAEAGDRLIGLGQAGVEAAIASEG